MCNFSGCIKVSSITFKNNNWSICGYLRRFYRHFTTVCIKAGWKHWWIVITEMKCIFSSIKTFDCINTIRIIELESNSISSICSSNLDKIVTAAAVNCEIFKICGYFDCVFTVSSENAIACSPRIKSDLITGRAAPNCDIWAAICKGIFAGIWFNGNIVTCICNYVIAAAGVDCYSCIGCYIINFIDIDSFVISAACINIDFILSVCNGIFAGKCINFHSTVSISFMNCIIVSSCTKVTYNSQFKLTGCWGYFISCIWSVFNLQCICICSSEWIIVISL